MPETETGSSRGLDIVAQVVSVGVGVLGATGYVLVLGAVVLWLRLADAQLPTEIPVSLASRQELIVIGAQALALWLLLAVGIAVLTMRGLDADPVQREVGLIALLASVLLSCGLIAARDAGLGGLAVAPALVLLGVVAGAIYHRAPRAALEALPAVAVGVATVYGLRALAQDSRWVTLLAAVVTVLAVPFAVPTLRERRTRREANEAALAHLEALRVAKPELAPELCATVEALIAELRQRVGAPATAARSLQRSLRWLAYGALALVGLGVVAVASQLDGNHNFRNVVVSLSDGRCLVGTYLARDADHLVMADEPVGKSVPARAVVIPAAWVRDVQVDGTRTPVHRLWVEPCGHKDAIAAPDGTAVQEFRLTLPQSQSVSTSAAGTSMEAADSSTTPARGAP